jgi:Bacteriophage HK97-gp10, putative tail-component
VSIQAQLEALIGKAAENLVATAADNVVAATREAAPAGDSGRLRGSIEHDDPDFNGRRVTFTLSATAEHAPYVEYGTGVYVGRGRIYPLHAKALTFFWNRGPNGPRIYSYNSIAGQPGQHYFFGGEAGVESLERRWHDALERASGAGAFAA